ncbi:MAG: hypothetical protein HDS31_06590 [Bacteroides sp.]|nr:hypothetical protein [Bacteroides sp.]
MKKTFWKWTVLTLLVAYAVGMAFWAHGEASRNVCRTIDVRVKGREVADSMTVSGIRSELAKYPEKILGIQSERVNTVKIKNYLSRLDAFEDVDCLMAADGSLQVIVTPMVPEFRVLDPRGDSYYVNKDGKKMKSNPEFFADVPVVVGQFMPNFPFKKILPVVRYVNTDPELSALVTGVKVNDLSNILLLPRIQGHVINIGDGDRLAEKRAAILTAYRKVLPARGWDTYDTISVKFRNQIVATRRDKTPLRLPSSYLDDEDLEEATLPEIESRDTTRNAPREAANTAARSAGQP